MDKLKIGNPRVNLHEEARIVVPTKNILQPGELGATIELIVKEGIFNPHGEIIKRIGPKKSESFLRQFLEMLYMHAVPLYPNFKFPVNDTSNVTQYITATSKSFDVTAASGDVNKGILVGTGNAAPAINDYALQTKIAHGTGAGQLSYGAVTFGATASDTTTSQFTVTRNFANSSGNPITVNEIGLACSSGRMGNTITTYYFLIIRDVIGGGIAVPNGQTLTVNYRPQCVV